MNATQLTVVRSGLPLPAAEAGELVVSDDEVRGWVRDGRLFAQIGRYRVSRLLTERLSTSGRPMLMWALRLMARRCYIVDSDGRERPVTFGLLVLWSCNLVRDAASRPGLLRRIRDEVDAIASGVPADSVTLEPFGAGAVSAHRPELRRASRRIGRPHRRRAERAGDTSGAARSC